jgi:crotonobetainyl-CoA:carnitine CoA-transferase CaiB-like acyl-CoA transferase
MMHGGETMREVKKRLAELSTEEVVARMTLHEVPCAPVVGLDAVRSHPQVIASGVLEEVDHPALGRIVQPRPPVHVLGAIEAERRPAPAAGQHTDEILAEAGFSETETRQLRESTVVG